MQARVCVGQRETGIDSIKVSRLVLLPPSGGVFPKSPNILGVPAHLSLFQKIWMHDSHLSPWGSCLMRSISYLSSYVSTHLIFSLFTFVLPFPDNEKPDSHYLKVFPCLLMIPGGTAHPVADSHPPSSSSGRLPSPMAF